MRRSKAISTLLILVAAIWLLSTLFTSSSSPDVSSPYPSREQALANDGASHHADSRPVKQENLPENDNKPPSNDKTTEEGSNGNANKESEVAGKSPNKEHGATDQSSNRLKGESGASSEHKSSNGDYNTGINEIKRMISELADVDPGTAPFTVEKSYLRDIKSDSDIQDSGELPPTSTILGFYLQVTEEEKQALSHSHQRVMSLLPTEVPKGTFAGRGIVMTGGGKYFPMVLTAIKWLRDNDPHTPVEVFMSDKSEYEPRFCEDLFPKLNVECQVLEDIYGKELSAKLKSQYAFKPLAILASKFDDVYFMDADSYPLHNVNEIFDWDVYKDTGYILNSDMWTRYISPRYYDIVGITLGGRARGKSTDHALLQHDRENAVPGLSTESGQVYIRKSQHIRSLMLATYYNLYGPGYYFPLLMQNGHGEGDKDTFAAAAVICNEPYYQTGARPSVLGQHFPGSFQVQALVQPDPRTDYEKFVLGKDVEVKSQQVHINGVKSNIKYLLMPSGGMRGTPQLQQIRYLGKMEDIRREGRTDEDIEQRMFRTMGDVACGWALKDGYIPNDWEDQDLTRLCSILRAHTQYLMGHPEAGTAAEALHWDDLYRSGKVDLASA